MNYLFLALLDSIGTIGVVVALVSIYHIPVQQTGATARRFLILSVSAYLSVTISNVLEQLSITALLDPLEDASEVLFFPFMLFFFYANWLWHETQLRKSAERHMSTWNERFRALMKHTTEGFYLFEPAEPIPIQCPASWQIESLFNCRIIECNDVQAHMFGYDNRENVIGKSLEELNSWHRTSENITFFKNWIEQGYTYSGAITSETDQNGDIAWFTRNITGITEQGKLIHIWGTQTDITKQKLAEEQLRHQHRRLQSVIEGTHIGTWEWNIQSGEIVCNDIWAHILGYSPQDLKPLNISTFKSLIHPEDLEQMEKYLNSHISDDLPLFRHEARMRHRNGSWVWVLSQGKVLSHTPDRKPLMMFGTNIDITDRKNSEEQVKAWQRLLEYVIRYDPNAIAVLDNELRYTFASDRYRKDYRLQNMDIIGLPHYTIFPDIPDKWRTIHKRALQGEVLHAEDDPFLRQDGTLEWISWECRPWYKTKEVIGGIILYTEVVTKRKKAEEQLKTSLREKEILLQEIYHRTKNNMQVISALLELQAASSANPEIDRIINDSTARIRAMALAQEKLYRSRSLSHINMKEYLTDLAQLTAKSTGMMPEQIELKFDLEEIACLIDIAIPCGLIVNELLANSFKHAFPDKRKGSIALCLHREHENQLHLSIEDNGIGVPSTFDFTRTTTLGIQLVLQIVQHQLHGEVSLNTEQGLCWHITFREDLYRERI